MVSCIVFHISVFNWNGSLMCLSSVIMFSVPKLLSLRMFFQSMISTTEKIQFFYEDRKVMKQPLACMSHTSNQRKLSFCVAKRHDLIKS